jgi:hypothetical protein
MCLDRLWRLPGLLSNGCGDSLPVGLKCVWCGSEYVRMELYLHRVYLGMTCSDNVTVTADVRQKPHINRTVLASVGKKNGIWSSRNGYFTFLTSTIKQWKTLRKSTPPVEVPLEQHRALDTPTREFVTAAGRHCTCVTSLWRKTPVFSSVNTRSTMRTRTRPMWFKNR